MQNATKSLKQKRLTIGIIAPLTEEGVADLDATERCCTRRLAALYSVLDLGVGHGLVFTTTSAGSVRGRLGCNTPRLGGGGRSATHLFVSFRLCCCMDIRTPKTIIGVGVSKDPLASALEVQKLSGEGRQLDTDAIIVLRSNNNIYDRRPRERAQTIERRKIYLRGLGLFMGHFLIFALRISPARAWIGTGRHTLEYLPVPRRGSTLPVCTTI